VKLDNYPEIPDEFKCPITLDLIIDPVTIGDGHHYERKAILQWLSEGNTVSPVTKQAVDEDDVNSDEEHLKKIKRWQKKNNVD